MGKNWIFALLTLTVALGLIGLLAYTSESVRHTAEPAPATAAPVKAKTVSAPAERETGPTFHRNGLMLTH
jgi:hypothetical protein